MPILEMTDGINYYAATPYRSIPYQDFSTYTEVDTGGKLTIATTKITAANLLRNEDSYVYYDFGASYFNALDIDFEIFISSASASAGIFETGLTVNTVNDGNAWGTSDIGVYALGGVSVPTIRLVRGATVANDTSVNLVYNTLYYCTINRTASSDTITCTIYSDAARTTVVDTLSVSGYGTGTTYRYLFGMTSYNSANNIRADGYIQNMLIN